MGRSFFVGWLAALCIGCGGGSTAKVGSGSPASSSAAGGSSSGGLALGSSSSAGSTSRPGGGSTSSGSSSSSAGSSSVAGSSASTGSGSTGSSSGGSSSAANPDGGAAGAKCFTDSECASNLCKQVVESLYVCVTACTSQADCAGEAGAFCEPLTVGGSNGYCIPGSPTTCAACSQDSDCGDLTEVCIPDPDGGVDGGNLACHPDCSLAGDAGCPSQYSCETVQVAGKPRQLCMPGTPSCLDEIGGDCSLVAAAQPCTRENADGSCTGQRTCTAATDRFSDCSASVPQELAACGDTPPAGCTELTAPSAVSTVQDCGSCGNVCPGNGLKTDVVTCTAQACTFACVGENYDVDGNPANGCEVAASPQGDHTAATAINLGAYDCNDGNSEFSILGTFPSDQRTHENPAIAGFDATTGTAPDFWQITGEGEVGIDICENDLQLNVFLMGSSNPACYQVTVNPNDPSYPAMTATFDAAGEAQINPNDSNPNYGSGDVITIELSKICSTPNEAPTFDSTNGHL